MIVFSDIHGYWCNGFYLVTEIILIKFANNVFILQYHILIFLFLLNTEHSKTPVVCLHENTKQESEDKIPTMYSDNDLSKLAARQIKAEIMGDTELAEKLKKQLEEARKIVKEKGFAKQPTKKVEEEVILTKVDSQGLARPIQTSQEKIESYKVC